MDPSSDFGYLFFDFLPGDHFQPLRLSLVIDQETTPAEASPVVLRTFVGGRAYLGAIRDAGGAVREWVEIWVQSIRGVAGSWMAQSGVLTEQTLQQLWEGFVDTHVTSSPGMRLETGWEKGVPFPLVLDFKSRAVARLKSPRSAFLTLCTDSARIRAVASRGPHAFGERYLVESGDAHRLVSVSDLLASNVHERALTDMATPSAEWKDFNCECGRVLVKRYAELSVAEFLTSLDAEEASPETRVEGGDAMRRLQGLMGVDWRFAPRERLVSQAVWLENWYLKVRLWRNMVHKVVDVIGRRGAPLLNLCEQSFRVGFSRPFGDAPRHWCTSLEFAIPGQGVSIPDPDAGEHEVGFVPFDVRTLGVSVKQDRERVLRGEGSFTLRNVRDTAGDSSVIVEGVLARGGSLRPFPNKRFFVYFQMVVGNATLDFWAEVSPSDIEHRSELRISAFTKASDHRLRTSLKAKEGSSLAVEYLVIEPVSFAVDLHALGVLGARILLGREERSFDQMLADLDRLLNQLTDASEFSAEAVENVVRSDKELAASFGPLFKPCPRTSPPSLHDARAIAVGYWEAFAVVLSLLSSEDADCRVNQGTGTAPILTRFTTATDELLAIAQAAMFPGFEGDQEIASVVKRFV